MKWLRCNNCYARADNAKEAFVLTKCGHAYCGRCIGQASRQCFVCGVVNVPTVQLQEPLDPIVAIYFKPPKDTFHQLLAVSEFQEEQIRITMKRLNEIDTKYMYAKSICQKLEMRATKMHHKYVNDKQQDEKRIRNLENEVIQLKLALDRARTSPAYEDFPSNRSSGSSVPNQHTCNKRYRLMDSKLLSFSPPMSVNTGSMMNNVSLISNGKYRTPLTESESVVFQIPNITKAPRSATTRSSASVSTMSANRTLSRLESMISGFKIAQKPNNNISFV